MSRVAVVTDSTANLPADLLGELNIATIPLRMHWSGETYLDGVTLSTETFYRWLRERRDFPTTSQPSVGDFVKFFRNVAEQQQTDTMIGVFISSELSGTFASATQARSELPDLQIELVDSRSASMGTGFQALVAARAARLGASPAEVLAQVEHVRETVQVLFVVDTLEFLHRGGRIGGAARFLGTALNLKPLLTVEDGRVEALEKVRSRRKSLQRLVELAAERLGGRPMGEVAVLDVDAREEADEVISQVVEQLNPRRVYRTAITPVIGAHTGPGAVGLIFYQD